MQIKAEALGHRKKTVEQVVSCRTEEDARLAICLDRYLYLCHSNKLKTSYNHETKLNCKDVR